MSAEVAAEAGHSAAVARVAGRQDAWRGTSLAARIELLDELRIRFDAIAGPWVHASLAQKGLDPADPRAGEEWLAGPYLVARQLRLLARSLRSIERTGRPPIPGAQAPGPRRIRVLPAEPLDRLYLERITAEVEVDSALHDALSPPDDAPWQRAGDDGLCLVLGGGNLAGIPPTDVLHQLFVRDRAVVLKTHPAGERLAPFLEEAFEPLVRRNVLAIVRGGSDVGRALVADPRVRAIHLTGSSRTYEAIVFGEGEAGRARLAARRPLLDKPVTAELGNVTPLIVVPGPWSASEIARQARHVASMLVNNAGFNCAAVRVVVTARRWRGRDAFLAALRATLAATPTRRPWYPGAMAMYEEQRRAHPAHELLGRPAAPDHVPWLLLAGLDPADDAPCFRQETFGPILAEVGLDAATPADFLERAAAFANETLWGTLAAHLIVHPASMRDRSVGPAVTRAIEDLRYGTIAVNTWAGSAFVSAVTPWGAAPGNAPHDIGSGTGFVHNALFLDGAHRTVVTAPFRPVITPSYLVGHRTFGRLAERVSRFEARRSPWLLPAIGAEAVRG